MPGTKVHFDHLLSGIHTAQRDTLRSVIRYGADPTYKRPIVTSFIRYKACREIIH